MLKKNTFARREGSLSASSGRPAMSGDVVGRAWSNPNVPAAIKQRLGSCGLAEDGHVEKAWLMEVCRDPEWSELLAAIVSRSVDAAGGNTAGPVSIDSFLRWSFPGKPQQAEINGVSGYTAPATAEADLEEPCSPKIGRKRDRKNKANPVDSQWAAPVPAKQRDGDDLDPTSPSVDFARAAAHRQDGITLGLPPHSAGRAPSKAAIAVAQQLGLDPTTCSGRTRRSIEKRARMYEIQEGEKLYVPVSQPMAVLLLREDHSFAYIHDSEAKFSEGVQGYYVHDVTQLAVTLQPTQFGWCYQQSFDEEEILPSRYVVTLGTEAGPDGRYSCTLPEELGSRFSWMDPSLPE
eukprot:TRINITY_DN693_c0_g2_i1.p1 TRINITY_DN693_c0_g2~~TRINITY_DN693_c0_g2_i1.p1  ORF type:complete len:355 (+),score=63.11 TRINITY_DN693_c0_g2_i1:23-1066(+)